MSETGRWSPDSSLGELRELYARVVEEHTAQPALAHSLRLDGEVALVSGGAGPGLGQACSERLAELGASVHVCDLDGDRAREVAERITGGWGTAATWSRVDASDASQVQQAVASAQRELGEVGVLVNSVGGGIPEARSFADEDPARFAEIVGRNLIATLNVTQAVLPGMIARRRGSIVNISSEAAAIVDTPIVYGACKAGVDAFTRILADQVGPQQVRVNSVRPGNLATPTAVALLAEETARAGFGSRMASGIARTSLARPGHALEVANVVAFLASPAASYVHGAVVRASGGLY